MGSVISGEGFFCLEFDEDEEDAQEGSLSQPNRAIISVEPGQLSLRILEVELKHVFEGEWDWQIAQMGDNDFVETFPTVETLRMVKPSGKLFLPLNDITTCISDSMWEKVVPEVPPEVWIKIYGVPPKHRCADCLKAGLIMLVCPWRWMSSPSSRLGLSG